jgi:deglycase
MASLLLFLGGVDQEDTMESLKGLKVVIPVTDGFEQSELSEPRKALDQAGAITNGVSPKSDPVRGWNSKDWGAEVSVDVALDRAQPQDFDALLPPGGVINLDAFGCGLRPSSS